MANVINIIREASEIATHLTKIIPTGGSPFKVDDILKFVLNSTDCTFALENHIRSVDGSFIGPLLGVPPENVKTFKLILETNIYRTISIILLMDIFLVISIQLIESRNLKRNNDGGAGDEMLGEYLRKIEEINNLMLRIKEDEKLNINRFLCSLPYYKLREEVYLNTVNAMVRKNEEYAKYFQFPVAEYINRARNQLCSNSPGSLL